MPDVVVIAGPNGAGKSTVAPALLRDLLQVPQFVNADQIAAGLSGFDPEGAAFRAGRLMLSRLHELSDQRVDFAFETTLSSRSFVPFLERLKASGYKFRLIYLWLRSARQARERVARRVRMGGHDVPAAVVDRRYQRSLANFFGLYQNLADEWRFYDNSRQRVARLVAAGSGSREIEVANGALWQDLRRRYTRDG
jgi:predicted ABC-type ATPase